MIEGFIHPRRRSRRLFPIRELIGGSPLYRRLRHSRRVRVGQAPPRSFVGAIALQSGHLLRRAHHAPLSHERRTRPFQRADVRRLRGGSVERGRSAMRALEFVGGWAPARGGFAPSPARARFWWNRSIFCPGRAMRVGELIDKCANGIGRRPRHRTKSSVAAARRSARVGTQESRREGRGSCSFGWEGWVQQSWAKRRKSGAIHRRTDDGERPYQGLALCGISVD
jgi:hypothetical protein